MSTINPQPVSPASSFKYHSLRISQNPVSPVSSELPGNNMAEPRSELSGSSEQNTQHNEHQPTALQTNTNGTNTTTTSAVLVESDTSKENIVAFQSEIEPRRRSFKRYLWPSVVVCLVIALIGVSVGFGVSASHEHDVAATLSSNLTATVTIKTSPTANPTSISPALTETTLQPDSIPPIKDAGAGIAVGTLSNYFSTVSGDPPIKLAFDGGSGRLCVRIRSGGSWLNNVQCVEGANPKPGTPITVLDWLGGTTIFFIAVGNLLSGIDNVPKTDTWRLSSLLGERIVTHELSQLGSVTWLNGTSAWVYYQDPDSQLREHGMDDYRDVGIWRDGSIGPLGLALNGTGIAVTRWLNDGGEVIEVIIQVANDALHGRLFLNSAWTSSWYDINGTPGTVSEGTSITAATIYQRGASVVLLCYISKNKFLTIQYRTTINGTDYSVYSTPKQLIEGDGSVRTGLAAISFDSTPVIIFVNNQTILELSGSDVAGANWSTVDVTLS